MQLLVTAKDVENYKTIKDSLDELRLLVEKSELWVFKAKKTSDGKKSDTTRKKSGAKDQTKIDSVMSRESFAESVEMQVHYLSMSDV